MRWDEAYKYLTDALKNYYNNNRKKKVIGRDLFNKLENHLPVFSFIENDALQGTKSIDPIQIYSSISAVSLKKENRIERIRTYLKVLDEVKLKEFNNELSDEGIVNAGCPLIQTTKTLSFREVKYQNQIWVFFDSIANKGQKGFDEKHFNRIDDWSGVGFTSVTIFSFWVNPRNFIGLDRRVISYFREQGKINKIPKKLKEYKEVLTVSDSELYIHLSAIAFDRNYYEKELDAGEKRDVNYFFSGKETLIGKRSAFKILAIQPLDNCNKIYKKNLSEGFIYYLYKGIEIKEGSINIKEELNIYDRDDDNIEVNINAIVGKNGSGKSALIELLYGAINNITSHKNKSNKNLQLNVVETEEALNVCLYIKIGEVYRIKLFNKEVETTKYQIDTNNNNLQTTTYSKPEKLESNLDLDSLFYTIGVNYSIHALNSNYFGNWIDKVFHKNDGYQTPIVLEPFREKGNININRQDELIKSKLLANLLERENKEDREYSLRNVLSNRRFCSFALDTNIIKESKIIRANPYSDEGELEFNFATNNNRQLLVQFFEIFLPEHSIGKLIIKGWDLATHIQKSYMYLIYKLHDIANTYNEYMDYKEDEPNSKTGKKLKTLDMNKLESYIQALYEDNSHKTYKLWQIVNFIHYKHYRTTSGYNLDKMSDKIFGLKSKKNDAIERYLPPPIFTARFYIDKDESKEKSIAKKINFDTLSSGERQQVFAIHTILYHIKNIDSAFYSSGNKYLYSSINLILDEIELYFHPEMQRKFLYYLLKAIKSLPVNNIRSVQITFVTHSPFVLTDIPDTNILFLGSDDNSASKLQSDELKTFGANTYDLLIDGFFMESPMGAYSNISIKKIIKFYKKVKGFVLNDLDFSSFNKEELRDEYKNNKEYFSYIREIVGEPYLKSLVTKQLTQIESWLERDYDSLSVNEKVTYHEKAIELLKKENSGYDSN